MNKKIFVISIITILIIIVAIILILMKGNSNSLQVREKSEILRLYNENANDFQSIVEFLSKIDGSFSISLENNKVKIEPKVIDSLAVKPLENKLELILKKRKFNIITKDDARGYIMFGSNQGIIYSKENPSKYIRGESSLINNNWYYFLFYLV